MKMKLEKMEIRNFKGFEQFTLEPNGEDMKIYGGNSSGKSTVYDAFIWALFGKDSRYRSDFAWKPLTESGEEKHHLETEVTLTLNIDGEEIQLTRMAFENWKTKRGTKEEVYSGNSGLYKVNGIEKLKKEYDAVIAEFIDEKTFLQLTGVFYIGETMQMKDRRQLVFNTVGEPTLEEVIESNKALEDLPKILGGKSVADKQQLIKQDKKHINKQLKDLPARIDEVQRSLPEIAALDKKQLEKDKTKLNLAIKDLQKKIDGIENGGYAETVQKELDQEKADLALYESQFINKQQDKLNETYQGLNDSKEAQNLVSTILRKHKDDISDLEDNSRKLKLDLSEILVRQTTLKEEYSRIYADEFKEFDEHVLTCAYCNRDYDESEKEQIKENYDKERYAHNARRAADLKENMKTGKANAEKIESLEKQIAAAEEMVSNAKKEMQQDQDRYDRATRSVEAIENNIAELKEKTKESLKDDETYKGYQQKIDDLENDLESNSDQFTEEINEIEKVIESYEEDIEAIADKLSDIAYHKKQNGRIDELVAEQKELNRERARVDEEEYLIEEYTRSKVDLMEYKINNEFKIVRFKMFTEQNNGGIDEICEPTVKGIPFSGGLNNAAKVNAGLDIINTVSRKQGVSVPIFIDNSESVTDFIETDSQRILLEVDKNRSQLRTERV